MGTNNNASSSGISVNTVEMPVTVVSGRVIATVAGASALLAKPLADLLLKVFKPLIKKILTKVTGKAPTKPTRQEILTNEYREKKGLPPIKKKK